MKLEKLKFCPHGKCAAIVRENSHPALLSYTTVVAKFVEPRPDDDFSVEVSGTYSVTTQRHIRAFFREYLPGYPIDKLMSAVREVCRTPANSRVVWDEYGGTSVEIRYNPRIRHGL